jgi:hypothetical protein
MKVETKGVLRHICDQSLLLDLYHHHVQEVHHLHKLYRTRITTLCRFSTSEDVSGQTPVKSSVQRSIRASILNQWTIDADTLEQIWPKKESLVHVKWYANHEPFLFLFDQ